MESTNVDDMKRKMSTISDLSRELSNISNKDQACGNGDDDDGVDLEATKYWKDYTDYFEKLGTIKKEIGEMRSMSYEYSGSKDFDITKYKEYQHAIDSAIKETNKSYKDFNYIDYDILQ